MPDSTPPLNSQQGANASLSGTPNAAVGSVALPPGGIPPDIEPRGEKEPWDWFPQEARSVVQKTLIAAYRGACLSTMILIHLGVDWIVERAMPAGWHRASELTQGVFFVTFLLVYLDLSIEFVGTFMPNLMSNILRFIGGKKNG
jgi:hypothetical protein